MKICLDIWPRTLSVFREVNRCLRAQLKEKCELQRTDNARDQMEAIVFIILRIFFATYVHSFENWGISFRHAPGFAVEYS